MSSNRPYLIRAMRDWIEDNGLTTYIFVNATLLGVKVPKEHINKGKIVLDISENSVRDFEITNQAIAFKANFSGVTRKINIPVLAVMAIFAKENSVGMNFSEEETLQSLESEQIEAKPKQKPQLKVIRTEKD